MSVKGTLLEAKLRNARRLTLPSDLPSSALVVSRLQTTQRKTKKPDAAITARTIAAEQRIDTVRESLAECLRLGMHPTAAAAGLGIARETLSRWLSDGRKDFELGLLTPYARLFTSLQEAQAEAEKAALNNLSEAAQEPKHWMASAWFLERRFPDRWAKKTKTELSGPDGGPIKHQVAVLMVSEDKLRAAMALADGKPIITIDAAHESATDAEEVMR